MRDPPKHPHVFEHKQSGPRFIALVVFYGLLGSILGRLIDKGVAAVQGTREATLEIIFFFVLQIFVNALVIYIGFKSLRLHQLTLDDWISSTFQGVLFVTMSFSVQDNFYANARALI